MPPIPEPFRLAIDNAAIADLRERLGHTRFPDQGPGEPWGLRHRSRLHAWPRRVLAARFRLARTGGAAQRLSAIQAAARRYRAAFPARAGQRAVALPAPAVAWLAGLSLRVPRHDPAPRRSRPLWRRCERRPHDHRAVTARLRPLLCARAEALWDRGDRRCDDRADAGARLSALCRARRRLGRLYRRADGMCSRRETARHSCEPVGGSARTRCAASAT